MEVTVVGAGLAGSECSWQLANRGWKVCLVEQKPQKRTPAQQTDQFAELVCSNSLRGAALHNAVGLLKEELRRMNALTMQAADATRVPAGGALAVEREKFSAHITRALRAHSNITIACQEVLRVPQERPLVLATGPLTGDALAQDLSRCIGESHLSYYDAIAPVVEADSLDLSKIFRADRYGEAGVGDYLNAPLSKEEYEAFVQHLIGADRVAAHAFEEPKYFEGCLPVEVLAERGPRTLSFGPMKPVGLRDPRTGHRPHAVVQLRAEDAAATAYNLVGFQTRMTHGEQKRVLRTIPGLEQAEFQRFGTIHRNTFINAPNVLRETLDLRDSPEVYLAGQMTGVEGYIESAASGFFVGLALSAHAQGQPLTLPLSTALGALRAYTLRQSLKYQPSNVVWSMFPPLPGTKLRKRARHAAYAERALRDLGDWKAVNGMSDAAE